MVRGIGWIALGSLDHTSKEDVLAVLDGSHNFWINFGTDADGRSWHVDATIDERTALKSRRT